MLLTVMLNLRCRIDVISFFNKKFVNFLINLTKQC